MHKPSNWPLALSERVGKKQGRVKRGTTEQIIQDFQNLQHSHVQDTANSKPFKHHQIPENAFALFIICSLVLQFIKQNYYGLSVTFINNFSLAFHFP